MPALQWNILISYYNLLNLAFYKLYIINLINLKFREEKNSTSNKKALIVSDNSF